MKIRVDGARCQGHAQCWVADEELFPLDDNGYSVADGIDATGREEAARQGADVCPERAIVLDA